MPPLLIVAKLAIRSSYARNFEEPASDSFDTVQLYHRGPDAPAFRVRTFAVDHDIHVHGFAIPSEDPREVWLDHLHRIYGDALSTVHEVPLKTETSQDLAEAGLLTGHLEGCDIGFAFWNPDGEKFCTKSAPPEIPDRRGLKEIAYLGGMATFWLPESWLVEESAEEGGCFWDPKGQGTLWLSVLTFEAQGEGEPVAAGEALPTGLVLNVSQEEFVEDGVDRRMRTWQMAQALPGKLRVFVFSYAYDRDAEEELTAEIALLDREIRLMRPHHE